MCFHLQNSVFAQFVFKAVSVSHAENVQKSEKLHFLFPSVPLDLQTNHTSVAETTEKRC